MKIYIDEAQSTKALIHSQELLKRFPKNPIFLFYQHKILLMSGNKAKAGELSVMLMQVLTGNPQCDKVQTNHFQRLLDEDAKKYK
jgi:predicted Zn-dependent protease